MKSFSVLKSLFIFFLFISVDVYADWNPFIIHYDTHQYGEGTHTWGLKSAVGGWIYAANEGGLFQYDGSTWVRKELPNHSPLRSVCLDSLNRRVYVGAINQIGYFQPDGFGQLKYTMLFDVTSPGMGVLNNIWDIHQVGSVFYFRGDRGVMRYSEERSLNEMIEAPAKITASAIVSGFLYIGCQKGIYILIDNQFHKLHGTEGFKGHLIRSIVSSKEGTLILTSDQLFVYDGVSVKPFKSHLTKKVIHGDAFCMAVHDNTLAVGTINRGVIICQLASKQTSKANLSQQSSIRFINERKGLQNNTVLSLCFDQQGMLWAGLDRGIDRILLSSPLTNLYTFPDSYGTGYTSVKYHGTMYFGTNRGVYVFNKETDANQFNLLTEIPNSSGQVWKLAQIGNDLFCLHDKGVFLIENKQLKSIGVPQGTLDLLPLKDEKRVLLAHYDGLSLIEYHGDRVSSQRWERKYTFPQIQSGYNHLVMMPDSSVWATDMYSLTHLQFSKDWSKVISHQTFPYESICADISGTSIDSFQGRLELATNVGLFYYDDQTRRFKSDHSVDISLTKGGNYRFVTSRGDDLWTLSNQILRQGSFSTMSNKDTVSSSADTLSSQSVYRSLHQFPLSSHLDFVTRNGSCIWFGNDTIIIPYDRGFAFFDVAKAKAQRVLPIAVHIKQFYITYPERKIVYRHHIGRDIACPEIPWSSNYLEISFGVNRVSHDTGVVYRYRLNKQEWSQWTEKDVKEYAGLYEGDYTFVVEARNFSGQTASTTFHFTVLPPWWRTVFAYLVYSFFFIGLICIFYLFEKRRLKKRLDEADKVSQRRIEEQEEAHKKEQEYKQKLIIQLEKENLEYELSNKRQEVTNLLLSSAKQNELLEELKADLHKVQLAVRPGNIKELRQRLLILTNRIDTTMKNKQVLERVEKEFNMLHNNFMDRLKQQNADLNQHERMMCIYIRMHLSSKEIAPLLNLSTRGVETIRYRLRKKFNLQRGDSLSGFLKSMEQETDSLDS